MSETSRKRNPLRRDGTSQRQRSPRALAPSSVAVDERQLSDHLLYVREVARLLRYVGPDGLPAGDWSDFLDQDPTLIAAAVAETDPEAFREDFEARVTAVATAPDKAQAFADLIPPIVELGRAFERWYRGSPDGLSLRASLERLIGSVLRDVLRGAITANLRAEELGLAVEAVAAGEWSEVWGLAGVEADRSLFPAGLPLDDGELRTATARMERIAERFYEALVFLAAEAPAHLAQTLTDYPRHPPHMALLLAFLQLLGHARDHLNTLTEAHLDFYYRRVLGLEPRQADPDRVHLVFELAKRFESHSLAADTALKAGKDAGGVELLYATDEEIVVNRAQLDPDHGLKTLFVDKAEDGTVVGIHAAPDADSGDGLGGEIDDEDGKWQTFGGRDMPGAEIGFAVASPMLFLAEGERQITLDFELTDASVVPPAGGAPELIAPPSGGGSGLDIASSVKVYASGEEEWLEVTAASITLTAGTPAKLTCVLQLGAGDGAVVAYDDGMLGDGFSTVYPVVKLVLDDQTSSYPYRYFQQIEVAKLALTVKVGGMRNLILENDLGVLNPAKPFHPFSPVPKKGGSFLVGSPEAFLKPLTTVTLGIEWADLPEESFDVYYEDYVRETDATQGTTQVAASTDGQIVTGNGAFNATFSVLYEGAWQPQGTSQRLFDDSSATGSPPAAAKTVSLTLSPALSRVAEVAGFDGFSAELRRGFLRATLVQSFLHRLYPKLLAAAATAGHGEIPNPPYTPMMASMTLDYQAELTLDYSREAFDSRVEQLFQIGPFGHREVFPIADDPSAAGVPISRKLVPELEVTVTDDGGAATTETAEGALLIGLDDLEPPQNLSLLFQVAEGSEDPMANVQDIAWSYLADDVWVDFETSEVLADSTRGLLQSGIVRFATPAAMTPAATVLPAGRHWIKASVAQDSRAVPQLIAVHAQAAVASFRDQGNDPGHLAASLPAETIAKLKQRAAAVKSVTQPYSSFGGRMREEGERFYLRVSERLRHRGRAVTIFDYERLVLERFPEVYKVRCLNHTGSGNELAPGHVSLVLVPNLRNKNAVDPLKPRLSLATLDSIREYLSDIASDFVTLEVKNPDYEEVRVSFSVRFHAGRDKGFYTGKLDEDIVGFLSPWLLDDAADVALGGRIHRSAILDFVEKRDYVDFVTDFRMDHIIGGEARLDVEQAEATTSSAALVSAKSHTVSHSAFSCLDREVQGP